MENLILIKHPKNWGLGEDLVMHSAKMALKEKHLEKLANKMLENDEKLSKLKGKNINTDFLNLF